MHTCDSTAWRADVLYSQTQLTSTAAQHSRTHNHTNSLTHSQHAHTPSHTCADAQMPWGVCVLTPRRQYSAPCHRNDCAARAREQAPETHLPPSAAHALGTRTRRMLTPAGIYCSGLRPPGRRLRNPTGSPMLRFCRPFLPTRVHACTRMRAGARAQAAPAHAVPPHSRHTTQRRPAVGSAAPEPSPGTPSRAPQIGATAYIWCVMAFLMSALMRAVLLNQYDGLCEKSGCPHESPVRPQSCTPKASSLDVHWRLNIFVTSLRTQQYGNDCLSFAQRRTGNRCPSAQSSLQAQIAQLRAVAEAARTHLAMERASVAPASR